MAKKWADNLGATVYFSVSGSELHRKNFEQSKQESTAAMKAIAMSRELRTQLLI